jgi:dTDP-4-dehydrorhamnose 3,5-epimerase
MDHSDASYEMSAPYTPGAEGGLPHDDPRLALPWPLPVSVISAKDRNFRPLAEIEDEIRRRMVPALPGAVNADKTFVSV